MFKWMIHHLNALYFFPLTPSCPVGFVKRCAGHWWWTQVDTAEWRWQLKTLASGVPGCVYELSTTLTSLLHRTCAGCQLVPFPSILRGLGRDPSIKINNNNNDNNDKKKRQFQFSSAEIYLIQFIWVQFEVLLQETMATSPKEVFQPIRSRGNSSNGFQLVGWIWCLFLLFIGISAPHSPPPVV